MPFVPVTYETNAATIATSTTGAGTYNPVGAKQVVAAAITVSGYVTVVTAVGANGIGFQLYQQAGSVAGAFAAPTAVVDIAPGSLQAVVFGE